VLLLLFAVLFMGSSRQDVTDLNQRAKQALEKGQAADAVLYLESAVNLKPDDAVLARNLGYAYFKRGQAHYDAFAWDAALGDYRRAIAKAPDVVGYRLHLASLALRLYRLDEALSASQAAVKAEPENALAYQLLGDTLNLLDKLPQAKVAYRKAQELGDVELAARAGKALARTERQHAVEKDYRTDVTSTFVIRHPGDTEFLELAGLLDRARAEVCNTFDEFPRNKAIVVLYPPEAFRAVTGAHDWVGGLFDRKIRLPVADPKLDGERIEASFRHEYTHLIMSELSPRCPVYLNEGLAQLAEYGRGEGIPRLVEYMERSGIARQDLPRIEDLPESFLEIGDSGQVHLGYLLSFAFVDHVVSQHGMGAAIRWVRALEGQSAAEAYQKVIGRTLQHEETLFRELVRTARG
jgi:hypothetical protein